MKQVKRIGHYCAGLMLAATITANAAVVRYDQESAFLDQLPDATGHRFEGIVNPADAYLALESSPIVVDGVGFSSNARGFVISGSATHFALYGASFFSGQDGRPNSVVVTLDGVSGVGFRYGSYFDREPARPNYLATLNTGDSFEIALPADRQGGLDFVGFISDADPIVSVTFSSLGESLTFDIAGFVTAPVPIPNALLPFLAALGVAYRRGRRRASGPVAPAIFDERM